MTENETFIYESIFNHVRMGFLPVSEIKEIIIEEIEDNGFDQEISEKWAIEHIDEEYNKARLESKNWETPTQTECLINAFDQLCENNIIALHNAGYTTSDGEYEVVDVERSLQENNRTSDGYCFYHEQDLMRAISLENPCLYIAYQKVNNSDKNVTLEVGKKVVEALKANGFNVDWNEDINSKILIPNFKWQHIYNGNQRDLQNYDDTIALMLQQKPKASHSKNNDTNTEVSKNIKNNSFWSKLKNLWS
jgi:hypothetical protein